MAFVTPLSLLEHSVHDMDAMSSGRGSSDFGVSVAWYVFFFPSRQAKIGDRCMSYILQAEASRS